MADDGCCQSFKEFHFSQFAVISKKVILFYIFNFMLEENKKELYSWSDFGEDIKKMAVLIKSSGVKFESIWGPARGGLPLAVSLSHALHLPFVATPNGKTTLIVDDIADTGKTLKNFADQGYFIATIFYHKQSEFVPSIWLREKEDDWVVFPWEEA